jgi:putative transposase
VRDLPVLFLHLLVTVVPSAGPGGAGSVMAESVLVKQQLLILNRCRKRSSNFRLVGRVVVGVSALLMRPRRMIRSAIVLTNPLEPSLSADTRKYRRLSRLYSPRQRSCAPYSE